MEEGKKDYTFISPSVKAGFKWHIWLIKAAIAGSSHITFGACIEKSRLKHSQVGVCQRVFNINLHTEATVRADIGQRN